MKNLQLTKGLETLIDDDDYARVSERKWSAAYSPGSKRYYAVAKIPGLQSNERLHRFIMGAVKGMVVDHINNDPLDNRKANLRVCTQGENLQNIQHRKLGKSGYRGVIQVVHPSGRIRYYPWIKKNEKRVFIGGGHDDAKEAALIRDKAAIEHYGAFTYTNFPK